MWVGMQLLSRVGNARGAGKTDALGGDIWIPKSVMEASTTKQFYHFRITSTR